MPDGWMCQETTEELKALTALQRVEAATNVGVNIGEYNRLVAEAQVAIREMNSEADKPEKSVDDAR